MQNRINLIAKNNIKILQKATTEEKLIIFVGAGISMNSGLPSWNDVIKSFASELGITSDCNSFSAEDALKTPQLYFNKFKKKKYNQKVNEIFSGEFKPNILHKIIFDLKPRHIITTNYDNLLEKYATQNLLKYNVATKDIDLYGKKNNNFIIKMHGDINNNNFVLKEDDYLNYSENYKLIEAYIKGLFSTHTILFVGFSANDPNVKQIFKWIKQVIGKYKSAFLLDIDETKYSKKFELDYNYFSSIGITKIPYFTLEKEIQSYLNNGNNALYSDYFKNTEQIKYPAAQKVFDLLFCIKENILGDGVDKFYKPLEKINRFNYLPLELLEKSVDSPSLRYQINFGSTSNPLINDIKYKFAILYPKNYDNILFYLSGCKLLSEEDLGALTNIRNTQKYPNKYNNQEKEFIDRIIFKLKQKLTFKNGEKNKLKTLYLKYFTDDKSIVDYTQNINNLFDFNYKKIDSTIKNSQLDFNIFEKAFCLYKKECYKESYDELDRISFKAFSANDTLIYAIAELNKLSIYNSMQYSMQLFIYKHRDEILQKQFFFNEKSIYEKIDDEDIKKLLKNIFNFSYFDKVKSNLLKEFNKIKEVKDEQLMGMENVYLSTKSHYLDVTKITLKLWHLINLNYLLFDNYTEIKSVFSLFAESLFLSFSIDNTTSNYGKISSFDYFNLFLMIDNLKYKDLKNILDKYKINLITTDEKTKADLVLSFKNYIDSIVDLELKFTIKDKIFNFLSILSRLDLTNSELKALINSQIKLCKYFISDTNLEDRIINELQRDIYDKFTNFTVKIHNNRYRNERKLSCKVLEAYLCEVLNCSKYYDVNEYNLSSLNDFVHEILSLIKINDKTKLYKFANQKFLEWILNKSANFLHIEILLPSFYPFVSEELIAKYKDAITVTMQKLDKVSFVEFVYQSAVNGAIDYNLDNEKKLLSIINDYIKIKNADSIIDNSLMDFHNTLIFVLHLNIKEIWINNNKLKGLLNKTKQIKILNDKTNSYSFGITKDLKRIINQIDLCINLENFNFKEFSPEDAKFLNEKQLKRFYCFLNNNPKIKKMVYDAYMSIADFKDKRWNDSNKTIFEKLFPA